MDGVAAVALPRVVEVYHVELGLDLVAVQMGEQVVVGYLGEVGVLEIIQEKRIALLDGLFYVLVDYRIGLARTGRAQDHRRTEGIDKVDPSVIRPAPEPEAGAEVDGILVLLQLGLLHEGFVLDVEHVFEQVGLQQAGHPQPRHEQADIPGGKGGDIQHGARRKRQRKGEQPPVAEKEQQAGHAAKDDPAPRDFLLLHALCAEAAKGEEQHGEELRPEDIGEQPGGTLEAEQYPIDHADVDAPLPDGLVTEPINIDDYK